MIEIILKRKNVVKKVFRRDKAEDLISKGFKIVSVKNDDAEPVTIETDIGNAETDGDNPEEDGENAVTTDISAQNEQDKEENTVVSGKAKTAKNKTA